MSSVNSALRARDMAFKSGDNSALKRAKYAVRKAITDAKPRYQRRLEDVISSINSRDLWSSFNKITGYKPKSVSAPADDV